MRIAYLTLAGIALFAGLTSSMLAPSYVSAPDGRYRLANVARSPRFLAVRSISPEVDEVTVSTGVRTVMLRNRLGLDLAPIVSEIAGTPVRLKQEGEVYGGDLDMLEVAQYSFPRGRAVEFGGSGLAMVALGDPKDTEAVIRVATEGIAEGGWMGWASRHWGLAMGFWVAVFFGGVAWIDRARSRR